MVTLYIILPLHIVMTIQKHNHDYFMNSLACVGSIIRRHRFVSSSISRISHLCSKVLCDCPSVLCTNITVKIKAINGFYVFIKTRKIVAYLDDSSTVHSHYSIRSLNCRKSVKEQNVINQ